MVFPLSSTMEWIATAAQHIGSRPTQQDSYALTSPADTSTHRGLLGIVCDGMGGMRDGDRASRSAVNRFVAEYQRKSVAETVDQALARCLVASNRSVVELAAEAGILTRCGTTLLAACIHGSRLHWISVGDCGLFLLRGGVLRQLNQAHNFARMLDVYVKSGQLEPEIALNHPSREALTSYVGNPRLGEVDRNREPMLLEPGDCVIVSSDGLFRAMAESEIAAVAGRVAPDTTAEALVEAAIARGHRFQDNVTVCAMRN